VQRLEHVPVERQDSMAVKIITSVKVIPMPMAVSRFFETPKKMQSPR